MKNMIKEFSGRVISQMKLYEDILFIVFNDGNYTAIEITADYDGGRDFKFIDDIPIPWMGYHYEAMIELGIITEAEAKKILNDADEKAAAAREEIDRAEYERLKAKYAKGE